MVGWVIVLRLCVYGLLAVCRLLWFMVLLELCWFRVFSLVSLLVFRLGVDCPVGWV